MTTFRNTAQHRDVEAVLERIVGEECWAIIAGPGTGSVILLDLGAKLPRDVELKNPHLSEDERKFEAPYSMHIWCSWRVEVEGRVVGSAIALPEEGWWERSGLAHVKGHHLTSFELSTPIPDLRLQFGEATLSMFADTLSEDDNDFAFTVRTRDGTYVVFANGDLQREYVELP
jgi:hypothetical protein